MKIGFMGGSFDPVHFGHLLAAQDAYEQAGLDRLVWVPAAQAPLKPDTPQASAEARLAMVRAAVEGDARFAVCDYEVRRGGVNYTIDTVRYLETQYPGATLCWVIGADQVAQLHQWNEIGELAQRVEFIALDRPGWIGLHDPVNAGLSVRIQWCAGHLLALSSTELRQRVGRGLSLDYMIPHKTVEYIRENSLYRQK